MTQLTLLHHQVRSQNIVQPGYFVPRNVLADAYYTPVRCGPWFFCFATADLAGQCVAASSLLSSELQCDASRKVVFGVHVPCVCAYPARPLYQLDGDLHAAGWGDGRARARRLYLDGLDAGGGLTEAQLAVRARWLRQLDAERSALVRSVERYLHQMAEAKARGSAAELPPGRGKVLEWFGPLVEAIRAEQEAVRGPGLAYGPGCRGTARTSWSVARACPQCWWGVAQSSGQGAVHSHCACRLV